ncbi:pilus assembly protein [Caldichromatium japonicum]|uniref:Pilus assembly protein n=1 Tax=Caldichromatium japonicum TaxID=2699430 RepID=A0A6G7VA14_9GAMM|nr:PilX N-terminal domain-containing pilus assembly protein [Caldichromatium japonicum]QIK36824.1 pilus assembly protein [Caldichromatium japonicum]
MNRQDMGVQKGRRAQRAGQAGAALILTLLFLVLIILVAISGIQTVALEERMAGASSDRNLAFQAAEAALRVGESVAEAESEANPPNSGFPNNGNYNDASDQCPGNSVIIDNCNANGLCPVPDKDCLPRWQVAGFNKWKTVDGISLGALAGNAPQYFIEYLGGNFNCYDGDASDPKNCYRYRITARSNPATGRATVVLQSIYATD